MSETSFAFAGLCSGAVAMMDETSASPLAQRLGANRAIILHVDDLGMCHGANRAFLSLAARGLVTCGSVMVPCPWFREIAEAAAADPALDIGVHLTLTSEWAHYRWAPISTSSRSSGLIDEDGYFWRDLGSLRRHLVPEAAEIELRAQVERAIAAGLRPTHLDAHMAAAMLPELLPVHIELARERGIVPVLPRNIRFAPDPQAYGETVAALEAAGVALPDHFRGTLPVARSEAPRAYRHMIESLPNGVTHIALHCTEPGEIETIAPDHADWRVQEYALLDQGHLQSWCEIAGVTAIGYRAVQQASRAARSD
jgi:predicted glycoside hydrolase/deacetylase ChbG (UPF0249 family)